MSSIPNRSTSSHIESIEDRVEHIKVLQDYLNKIESDEFESDDNETVEETARFILSSIFVTSDDNIMLVLKEVCYMMTIRPKLVKNYVELVRRFYRTKDYERIHKIFSLLISKLTHNDSFFLGAVCLLKELLFQNIITLDQVMDICLTVRSEQVHALIYFSCVEKIKTINLKTLDTITAHLGNDSSIRWLNMRRLISTRSITLESLYVYASEVYPSQTPPYLIKIDALDGLIELFSSNPDSYSVNGVVESNLYETCELANNSTYLQFALLYNSPDCANWLICNGADMKNCFQYAVAGGNIKLIQQIDQNNEDNEMEKKQAVEIALQFRRDDIVQWLMECIKDYDEKMTIYAFFTNNYTAISNIIKNQSLLNFVKKNKIDLLRDSIAREDKQIVSIILHICQVVVQEEINSLKQILDMHKEFRGILQKYLPLIGRRISH